MSGIWKKACDNCKKETSDRYVEYGWMVFQDGSISISKGRRANGAARTKFIDCSKELDFCSLDCLIQFLKNENENENEKERS